MRIRHITVLLPALSLVVFALADEAPKPAEPGTLVVIDSAGKEQKLKSWKFTEGVRRLGWLAPAAPAKAPEPKKPADKDRKEPAAPAGPEALAFRADTTVHFVDGVLTLIPLDRLRSLDYDKEKDTVTARVAVGPKGEDEELVGTTKYKKINKLVLEAEVDKGDLGVAEIKYLGGYPRGIRGIRFPPPKAAPPAAAGRPATVVAMDGENKTTHKVADLQPLYRFADRSEKLLPTLMFKKTLKIDVAKVKKIAAAAAGRDETSWQVTLKDGGDETLTLLETVSLDGKQARLEGLVGRGPAGYKLFPILAIAEITFDAAE